MMTAEMERGDSKAGEGRRETPGMKRGDPRGGGMGEERPRGGEGRRGPRETPRDREGRPQRWGRETPEVETGTLKLGRGMVSILPLALML